MEYSLSNTLDDKKEIPNNDNLIKKKKKLIEIAGNLTKMEYLEIFNIFIEDNCQYSENINGVFINLNNINNSTIDKIYNNYNKKIFYYKINKNEK
jgi:hypothetical protein